MFKKIRRPGRSHKDSSFKKIFTYFIFGLICAVFLFIAPMGSQLIGEGMVAKVGREQIMARELKQLEEAIKDNYQRQRKVEEWDEASLDQIRSSALQQLIDLYMVYSSSKREGFFISDQELKDNIQSFPVFQEKGRFLYSRYLEFLKLRRISSKRYEEQVRRQQTVQNWQELFDKAFQSNELEKQRNKKREQYKVQLEYAEMQAEEIKEEEVSLFLKEKNLKELNLLLKKAGGNWQKTGEFALFLPTQTLIAQNQKVMSAIISHLPEKGLIPSLVRDNNKLYAINIVSFSQKEASKEENPLDLFLSQNYEKSNYLFETWLKAQKIPIKVLKKK